MDDRLRRFNRVAGMWAGLTVVALVAGSFSILPTCAFAPEGAEGCGFLLVVGWPVVPLIVATLGSIALSCASQRSHVASWLIVSVTIGIIGWAVGLWGAGTFLSHAPFVWWQAYLSGLIVIVDTSLAYVGYRLLRRQ